MKKQQNLSFIELITSYGNADQARTYLEELRWPKGPVCPHCKSKKAYKVVGKATSKAPARKGLCKCGKCSKQFTVTVGTVMEGSHLPLNKWLIAIHLFCTSKKAISAHQLHRMLGITYHASWFMCHRIRHAIKSDSLGFLKGTVEVDETYVGGKFPGKRGRGSQNKTPVVALVQRGGNVRTRVVDRVTAKNLQSAILENVDASSTIMTDEWKSYRGIGKHYKGGHKIVKHRIKEYARGDVYTNTAESFFSLFKRGLNGSFHHVSKHHLPRYCDEFAFRWNHRKIKDGERMVSAIKMVGGKRLRYKDRIARPAMPA